MKCQSLIGKRKKRKKRDHNLILIATVVVVVVKVKKIALKSIINDITKYFPTQIKKIIIKNSFLTINKNLFVFLYYYIRTF